MLQLVIGIMIVLQATYIRPEYFTSEFTLFPTWPRFDAERSLALFALTMSILLAPKFFGLILAMFDGETRRGAGGFIRLFVSGLLEIIMSALLAPIMMLVQTGVMHILFGFDTGWNPQRRDDGSIPFQAIVRKHRSHMALGIASLIAGLLISPSLVAWMSPTIIGLHPRHSDFMGERPVCARPRPEAHRSAADARGKNVPPIADRANALGRELAAEHDDHIDCIRLIHADAAFRRAKPSCRITAVAQRAISRPNARWRKQAQRRRVDRGCDRLAEAERRMVALHDRALIDVIARLPSADASLTVTDEERAA